MFSQEMILIHRAIDLRLTAIISVLPFAIPRQIAFQATLITGIKLICETRDDWEEFEHFFIQQWS